MSADNEDIGGPEHAPKGDGALPPPPPSSRTSGNPANRHLPSLDEVFLADDEVEAGEDVESGEEETGSGVAFDIARLPSLFELDDETQIAAREELDTIAREPSDGAAREEKAPPSSARLSVPPGGPLSVRAAVSAPPMSVRPLRAPESAPPPFASAPLMGDLVSEAEAAPPSFVPEERDESVDAAPGDLADAELLSEPSAEVPPRSSVPPPISSEVSPWRAEPPQEAPSDALNVLFATARPASNTPPPPPSLAGRSGTKTPSVRPPGFGSSSIDPHRAPTTLLSAPPSGVARVGTPAPPVVQPAPLPSAPAETPWLKEPRPRRGWLWALLVVSLVGLLGFWFLATTQPGSLMVTVSGPGNRPLPGVQVFLDGKLACQVSPCEIAQVAPGTHLLRAHVEGYVDMADQAVLVKPNLQAVHNLALESAGPGTRLVVAAGLPDFKVSIDGKDYGTSPVELTDIAPGEHFVEVTREGFESVRERVTIQSGERHTLGPFNPRLLRGSLEVELSDSARGADVRLDGDSVQLPLSVKLDADRVYSFSAVKAGFAPFERSVQFSSKEPRINFVLELQARDPGDVPSSPAPHGSPAPQSPVPQSSAAEPHPAKATKGQATLSFNSLPASSVVLDGRPLGETPIVGVTVSKGSHSVVFIHPERGRKTVQVEVDEGATRAVTVRF